MSTQPIIEELTGLQAASPEELAAAPVAELVAELDRPRPGYRSLYYRWERQQWEAGIIDFEQDARDWTHRLFPEQRKAVLWLLSASTAGERELGRTLVSFVDAAPSEEQGVFLTTQLADAGRQTVLYERFGDAIGVDVFSLDVAWGPDGEIGPGKTLLRLISDISETLRMDRDATNHLVKGVAAQHLLLQGVTALTARTTLLRWLQKQAACPGLIHGLMAITRDEVRHVQFGLRFLDEHAGRGEGKAAGRAALDSILEQAAPPALSILDSGGADLDAIDVPAQDLRAAGMRTLSRRLDPIGVEKPDFVGRSNED
jgi:ribonucleoside-diphosphate reductase beta chain